MCVWCDVCVYMCGVAYVCVLQCIPVCRVCGIRVHVHVCGGGCMTCGVVYVCWVWCGVCVCGVCICGMCVYVLTYQWKMVYT